MPMTIGSPTGLAPEMPGVVCDELNYSSMDDESILLMLEQRMGDLDQQIGHHMRALESRTTEAQRLGSETQRFQALREFLSREPYMDVASGQLRLDREITIDDAAALSVRLGAGAFVPGSSDTITVQDVLDQTTINETSLHGVTSRETLQLRSEGLSEALRQCNSTNEQTMVRLQSCMQQRTQAVTMATNMLKALDESRDAVVGNLR